MKIVGNDSRHPTARFQLSTFNSAQPSIHLVHRSGITFNSRISILEFNYYSLLLQIVIFVIRSFLVQVKVYSTVRFIWFFPPNFFLLATRYSTGNRPWLLVPHRFSTVQRSFNGLKGSFLTIQVEKYSEKEITLVLFLKPWKNTRFFFHSFCGPRKTSRSVSNISLQYFVT